MRAGFLRDKCTFESPRYIADGIGGNTLVWTEEFQCYGELRTERGRESLEQGRLQGSNMALLTVRYSENANDAKLGWRVQIGDDYYQIRSVNDPDRRRRRLEFVLEKGVAQ